MFLTILNRRRLAASLVALSLVTSLSLVGCGSDAPTAPEVRGGDIINIDDQLNQKPNPPKLGQERMEDGR